MKRTHVHVAVEILHVRSTSIRPRLQRSRRWSNRTTPSGCSTICASTSPSQLWAGKLVSTISAFRPRAAMS